MNHVDIRVYFIGFYLSADLSPELNYWSLMSHSQCGRYFWISIDPEDALVDCGKIQCFTFIYLGNTNDDV